MTPNAINPRKPRRWPVGHCAILLTVVLLAWAPAPTAKAQVGPVPGIDYPFLFDDFHYPVSVPTSFDPGTTAYPANHVLGPSDWFVADGPAQPMTTTNSSERELASLTI